MRHVGSLILFLLTGALCFWQIWEEDFFWQIRAGNELLLSGNFPLKDSWSLTGRGEHWENFQWLWTVLLAKWVAIVGYDWAPLLRSILTGFFILQLYFQRQQKALNNVVFFALGIAFFVGLDRFQLRAELLVVVICQLLLLCGRIPFVGLFAICILLAQIHYGLLPLVFLLVAQKMMQERTALRKRSAVFLVCLLGSILLHPYGSEGLDWIMRHVRYAQSAGLPNPEHQMLSVFSLKTVWILLCFAALEFDRRRLSLMDVLKVHFIPMVFVALTIFRERTILFLLVSSFAPVLAFLENAYIRWRGQKRVSPIALAISGIVGSATIFFAILNTVEAGKHHFGKGLNTDRIPVDAINWMKQKNVKAPIFHTPSFGDALLGLWPEVPVFIDTREMMYDKFTPQLVEAWDDPAKLGSLLDRYGIQTIFLDQFWPVQVGQKLHDRVRDLFPPNVWSFVYSDSSTMVLVRRQGANADIAKQDEIISIRPNVPPSALFDGCSVQDRDRFREEVNDCLSLNPDAASCAIADWTLRLSEPGVTLETIAAQEVRIQGLVRSNTPLSLIWQNEFKLGQSWWLRMANSKACDWFGLKLN